MTTTRISLGEARAIPLSQLRLDLRNPRLQLDGDEEVTQLALARLLAEVEDALVVARSIARHGYYPWEVMIVIPEGDTYVVVEGNRRLTALWGLTDPEVRRSFSDLDEWEELAERAGLAPDDEIPCVVAHSRKHAQPALGYRHISGIEPWQPWAQARFIAHLIENDGSSEEEVSAVTGRTVPWVRSTYLNYRLVEQGRSWGFDTEEVEQTFSLVDVATSVAPIKRHLGLSSASPKAEPGLMPLPEDRREALGEVIAFIWGDEDQAPVISDSRQIRTLGSVIENEKGLEALRQGKSLDEAQLIATEDEHDPEEALLSFLGKAEHAVKSALREVEAAAESEPLSDSVMRALRALRNEVGQLLQFIDEESG